MEITMKEKMHSYTWIIILFQNMWLVYRITSTAGFHYIVVIFPLRCLVSFFKGDT